MAYIGDLVGGAISSVKKATGLQDVNLFPGDVNKKLTGVSAQQNYGTYVPQAGGRVSYPVNYTVNRPAVLGASKDATSPYGGGYNPQNTSTLPTGTPTGGDGGNNGGYSGPSDSDLINQEYNNFVSGLDQQGALANQNFQFTTDRIGREEATGLQQTADEQAIRTKELDAKAESGRQSERLNLQKVRQLLSELEQKQNAYGAVTGGGSSNEAMSDRFARTAQQSVGGVLQEGQRFANDVKTEALKASQFYAAKTNEIKNWAKTQIENARMVLAENLAQIQGAKNEAGLNKAQARLDLWRQYQSTIDNAKLQAANFQTQYDMWKQQLDASLKASQGYSIGAINPFNAQQSMANVMNAGPQAQATGVGTYQLPNAAYYQTLAKKTEDEQKQLLG